MAVIYHLNGVNSKVIIDSAILAPVSWSWILSHYVVNLIQIIEGLKMLVIKLIGYSYIGFDFEQ